MPIYKGSDAVVRLWTGDKSNLATASTHSAYAISDLTVTLAKGTVEQELIGELGNYSIAGALTIEGSLTGCKMYSTGLGVLLNALITPNTNFGISGTCGANGLHFYFKSCQVTGFDFTLGTADDITEGSVDFTLLFGYKVSTQKTTGFTSITDQY
jgi:hypothetical protein